MHKNRRRCIKIGADGSRSGEDAPGALRDASFRREDGREARRAGRRRCRTHAERVQTLGSHRRMVRRAVKIARRDRGQFGAGVDGRARPVDARFDGRDARAPVEMLGRPDWMQRRRSRIGRDGVETLRHAVEMLRARVWTRRTRFLCIGARCGRFGASVGASARVWALRRQFASLNRPVGTPSCPRASPGMRTNFDEKVPFSGFVLFM